MSLQNQAVKATNAISSKNSFTTSIFNKISKIVKLNSKTNEFIKNSSELKVFTTDPINNTQEYLINLAFREPSKFISYFANENTFENAIKINPNIRRILEENDLPVEYHLENITDIIDTHLIPVANLAKKIFTKLTKRTNSQDYVNIYIAGLLHDLGKAFMPLEVINKKGKLNSKERKIIELHNKLSYEILKTTQINPKIAQLALEHHNYDGDIEKNPMNQVLTVADVYCALREKRPYKKPIGVIGAKTIMYDMGANGALDIRYISYI